MGLSNVKRELVYLAISALSCVLIWKYTPLLWPAFAPRPAPAAANAAKDTSASPNSVTVNVNMTGFDPDVIEAKAGQPIKLAFFRPNDANCAREVVFPALGIRKELPPGQTTVVNITPTRTGPLDFACGMNMLKGKLIVR